MKQAVLAAALLWPTFAAGGECSWNCHEPWTKSDVALQTILGGLQLADWAQTRWFIKNPHYRGSNTTASETNPFLGSNPTVGRADILIPLSIIGHVWVSDKLGQPYRRVWQGLWIAIEGDAVHGNKMAGVRFSW